MKAYLFALCCLLLLSGCREAERPDCPERPPAGEIPAALPACLDGDVAVAEVEGLLQRWQVLDDEWGNVTAVDLLLGGGEELVVSYHPNLEEVIWNPQGRLLVLRWEEGAWEVAFDTATLTPTRPDGEAWDNWAYRPGEHGDATGEGQNDLLLKLVYSNGTHTAFTRHALLTAHDTDVLALDLLESAQYGHYRIDAGTEAPLIFTASLMGRQPITRTYTFTGRTFAQVDEQIDPAQATARLRLPDGSVWLTFDQPPHIGSVPAHTLSGLYRLADGELAHFPLQQAVRALAVGPDGALYVGIGCGLLRYQEKMVELAPPDCGAAGPLALSAPVTALAVSDAGTLWVGTPFSLNRYDGAWEQFDVNASRLLLAPDGSVWAAGWDGRADSGCCLTHLEGGVPMTYTYTAPLPVSPQLEAAIRALVPE